jgi:hypothetical protein
MDAETIRTYAEIGTAIGTFLLAIATFLTLMEMRKEKTPNIKIDLDDSSLSKKIVGHDLYRVIEKDAPVITFKALNRGQRAVSLERFELWMDNIEKLNVSIVSMGRMEEGRSIPHDDYSPLPQDLLPGKNYLAHIFTEDIAEILRNRGYEGEVGLIGHFIDQIGNTYKSDTYKFDINKFSEGGDQSFKGT